MPVRTRYIIPNFFTGLNFLIGIYAMLIITGFYHQSGETRSLLGRSPLIVAAWMILWCVLLDKLDGFAAKIMNASSGFGAQFDSLADLIAFVVAPAFLVFYFIRKSAPDWWAAHLPLLIVSVSVYVLCGAMRLARYNAKDADELGSYFHGLPSTLAGGFVSVTLITLFEWGLLGPYKFFNFLLPLILILLGLLMVSPLYLPKVVKRQNKWLNMLQPPVIASGYICGFGMIFPEYLFLLTVIYGVGGFGWCFLKRSQINFTKSDE